MDMAFQVKSVLLVLKEHCAPIDTSLDHKHELGKTPQKGIPLPGLPRHVADVVVCHVRGIHRYCVRDKLVPSPLPDDHIQTGTDEHITQ